MAGSDPYGGRQHLRHDALTVEADMIQQLDECENIVLRAVRRRHEITGLIKQVSLRAGFETALSPRHVSHGTAPFYRHVSTDVLFNEGPVELTVEGHRSTTVFQERSQLFAAD